MTGATLWRNATLATFVPDDPATDGYGHRSQQAILVNDGRIVWLGALEALPAQYRATISTEHDLAGALVTPALIDCHTHLVYAGSRAREFELRLEGASYETIARAGGGIRSTVAATRAADENTLFSLTRARAVALMREGVATVEIKSGYGLTERDEAKLLRVARRLGRELPLTVRTTFLGAHALPIEFEGRPDDYIAAVCDWLPRLAAEGLVDAVDVFCETIGFTPEQTARVFDAARALGLPVKLHAEQLSDQAGAVLAARAGALSCDHLEYLSDDGVAAMAAAGTVAVLLPGAFYALRETRLPPLAQLRAAGVPIALATDHNPGSSPTLSPLLMMNMACTLFRMTPLEAWLGFTRHAARALGLPAGSGTLAPATTADLAVWDAEHPRELVHPFGIAALRPLKHLIRGGVCVDLD